MRTTRRSVVIDPSYLARRSSVRSQAVPDARARVAARLAVVVVPHLVLVVPLRVRLPRFRKHGVAHGDPPLPPLRARARVRVPLERRRERRVDARARIRDGLRAYRGV